MFSKKFFKYIEFLFLLTGWFSFLFCLQENKTEKLNCLSFLDYSIKSKDGILDEQN